MSWTRDPKTDLIKWGKGEKPDVGPIDPLAPMSRQERRFWDLMTDALLKRLAEEDALALAASTTILMEDTPA